MTLYTFTVFPVRAGMNRHPGGLAAMRRRVPRACGDEPFIVTVVSRNALFLRGSLVLIIVPSLRNKIETFFLVPSCYRLFSTNISIDKCLL